MPRNTQEYRNLAESAILQCTNTLEDLNIAIDNHPDTTLQAIRIKTVEICKTFDAILKEFELI